MGMVGDGRRAKQCNPGPLHPPTIPAIRPLHPPLPIPRHPATSSASTHPPPTSHFILHSSPANPPLQTHIYRLDSPCIPALHPTLLHIMPTQHLQYLDPKAQLVCNPNQRWIEASGWQATAVPLPTPSNDDHDTVFTPGQDSNHLGNWITANIEVCIRL